VIGRERQSQKGNPKQKKEDKAPSSMLHGSHVQIQKLLELY